MNALNDFIIHLGVCLLIALYFDPSLRAWSRGHPQANAIYILNVFLGWTFLGWVLALVWAETHISSQEEPRPLPDKGASDALPRPTRNHALDKRPLPGPLSPAERRALNYPAPRSAA
jgi:hypothetical protein